MFKLWAAIGSVVMALTVAAGAFGAHGLRDRISEYHLTVFEKGVHYAFVHGTGILLAALLGTVGLLSEERTRTVCLVFLCGVILFSGSLWLLALTGMRWLGAVTPLGGTAFIAGWVLLANGLLRD